jgi:putative ABC transport system permease protein
MEIKSMQAIVSEALGRRRLVATLLAAFAAFALLLSTIGLYAVLSHAVVQRRSEIGLRMALGASRPDVLWLIVAEGMRLSTMGAALGAVLTPAAIRLLGAAFFGITGLHVPEILVAIATLLAAALLAVIAPALRASYLEPAEALRDR